MNKIINDLGIENVAPNNTQQTIEQSTPLDFPEILSGELTAHSDDSQPGSTTCALEGNHSAQLTPIRRKYSRADFSSEEVYQDFLRYQNLIDSHNNLMRCKLYRSEKAKDNLKKLLDETKSQDNNHDKIPEVNLTVF